MRLAAPADGEVVVHALHRGPRALNHQHGARQGPFGRNTTSSIVVISVVCVGNGHCEIVRVVVVCVARNVDGCDELARHGIVDVGHHAGNVGDTQARLRKRQHGGPWDQTGPFALTRERPVRRQPYREPWHGVLRSNRVASRAFNGRLNATRRNGPARLCGSPRACINRRAIGIQAHRDLMRTASLTASSRPSVHCRNSGHDACARRVRSNCAFGNGVVEPLHEPRL